MNPQAHRETGCWCSHRGEEHFPGRGGLSCHSCEGQAMLDAPQVMPALQERRRNERVSLPQPLRTSIAGAAAHVIDASTGGVGVMHQRADLSPATQYRLLFYSQYGPITFDCECARTAPNQTIGDGVEEGAWCTGLRIVSIDSESAARLRRLVMTLTEH